MQQIATDLHFLLSESNYRQSRHHCFPIILVTDTAESGAVPLVNKHMLFFSTCITAMTNICSSALLTPWPDTDISEGFSPGPEWGASRCLPHPVAGRRCGSFSLPGSGEPLVISLTGSSGCDLPLEPPRTGNRKRQKRFASGRCKHS